MSTDAKPQLTDEEKAAKRKEIEEQLAALKLKKEKEETQKTKYFGEHAGISCDGCGASPIVGYRYRCKACPNHDVCENCYDASKATGRAANGLGKQVLSSNAADHKFELYKDKSFSALVKGDKHGITGKKPSKTKPNDPCHCGSGIKFKKCCGKGNE